MYLSESVHFLMGKAMRGPFAGITQTASVGTCVSMLMAMKSWATGQVSLELRIHKDDTIRMLSYTCKMYP